MGRGSKCANVSEVIVTLALRVYGTADVSTSPQIAARRAMEDAEPSSFHGGIIDEMRSIFLVTVAGEIDI